MVLNPKENKKNKRPFKLIINHHKESVNFSIDVIYLKFHCIKHSMTI